MNHTPTNKNSFILYKDNYENIKELSTKQKADLLDAIFTYQVDKKEVDLDPVVKMAFSFIRQSFKRDQEKYEAIVMRNRENGQLGGRPKKDKPKKPSGLSGNPKNPSEPKKADSGSVSENGNENESEKIGHTKKSFKIHWEEIQKNAKKKYPDKDARKIMQEFLEGIEIKDYGYKNYKLAYFKWVRTSESKKVAAPAGSRTFVADPKVQALIESDLKIKGMGS